MIVVFHDPAKQVKPGTRFLFKTILNNAALAQAGWHPGALYVVREVLDEPEFPGAVVTRAEPAELQETLETSVEKAKRGKGWI